MARVLSIQVGRPRTFEGDDPWVTSIYKTAVTGPLRLEPLDLDGDEQAA